MERMCLVAMMSLLMSVAAYAQETEETEYLMRFLGVDAPEEADPEELERMADLIAHPLRINMVPESRLMASGLLTRYQVASLTDYRRRHGNVMSFAELAAVDGFGDEVVARLCRFISLECGTMHEKETWMQNDMALKTASKLTGRQTYDWNYGAKYRLKSDRFSLAIAASRSYSADTGWPDACSGSLIYDFRRFRGRLVIGDFNARFGQGLALWTGAFMTSLSSPDAFMKKPSGISDTWSFTGSSALTGVAGSVSLKRLTITLLTAVPGLKGIMTKPEKVHVNPAVNIAWQGRHGGMSVTHTAEMDREFRMPVMRTSADAAFCIRGVNLFGELAYDWVAEDIHGIAGADFPIGENARMAALVKYLPSKYTTTLAQHGAASSLSLKYGRHSLIMSADAIRYVNPKDEDVRHSIQTKLLSEWRYSVNDHWETRLRLSERLRTWGQKSRTDIRTDVIYTSGPLHMTLRANYLTCAGHAFVGYAEQGYKTGRFAAYLREGVFFVDDWEDRIYVYERDAPGSFNVPAMYGRGWFSSVVVSARLSRAAKLYFRGSYTGYDFMPHEKRKPGKAELRIQLVLRYL